MGKSMKLQQFLKKQISQGVNSKSHNHNVAIAMVPTPPGKSWITFCKISMPWKVLKNGVGPGNFSARSWNFLGYDVGGRHNDAGADAKICENLLRFYLYIRKNCWGQCSTPDPIVKAVCLFI